MVDYDACSKESIVLAAKTLTGKTLRAACTLPNEVLNSARNKGRLGTLVENHFFLINPGNSPEPDFPCAQLELKVTGVVPAKHQPLKAKERLVLSMIDYEKIVNEEWDTSSLLKKCKSMLLMFYQYEKEKPDFDLKFVIDPLLYEFPAEDLPQIIKDWEFIRDKVRAGKAHELSEGDTFYLGACRKGSGGDKEHLRTQPNSLVKAKARALSLKNGYLSTLVESASTNTRRTVEPTASTTEEIVIGKFTPYIGLTAEQIAANLNIDSYNKEGKAWLQLLAKAILATNGDSFASLLKADVEMKTIRLNKNGVNKEAMSFPAFKFLDILKENWEDSKFFERLEKKFLFIIFSKNQSGTLYLDKVSFWNMPFEDRLEAKKVWERTKAQVVIDPRNLPKSSENRVAHVRPHARNAADVAQTPQGDFHTKQGFWLNQKYITEVVRSL